MPLVLATPPVLGRDEELAAIDRAINGAMARAVVVAGPQGSGRTTLALTALERAAAAGREIVRCAATGSTTELRLAAVTPLLAVDGESADVATLLQRSMTRLRDRHRTGPGVVVLVDDAHLLDDASATLVHLVALAAACPLVVTVRSDLPLPDAIAAMVKDGVADRVDLDPLDEPAVAALAEAVLGRPLAESARTLVVGLSEGNPLAAVELLRAARANGQLAEVAGLWTDVAPLPPPPSLEAVLTEHVTALAPDQREVFDLVAVGGATGRAPLAALTSAAAVEDVLALGLLTEHLDRRRRMVAIARPALARIGRDLLRPSRQRELVARIVAAAVPEHRRRIGDALRLVDLAFQHGIEITDEAWLDQANDEAYRSRYDETTERIARFRAERPGAGIDDVLGLGDALLTLGRHAEVEDLLAGWADAVPDSGLGWFVNLRAYNLASGLGRVDEALDVVASGRARRPDLDSHFAAVRANVLLQAGRLRQVDELAVTLLDADLVYARLQARFMRSLTAGFRGDVEVALRAADEGSALHHEHRPADPTHHHRFRFGVVVALAEQGRFDDALREGWAGLEAGLDGGGIELQVTFRMALGRTALLMGDATMAAAMFRNALALLRRNPDPQAHRWSLGGLALAAVELGDLDTARRAVHDLDAIDLGQAPGPLDADLARRASAMVAAADGRVSQAIDLLQAAIAETRAEHVAATEGLLLVDLVRLDRRAGAARRLAELAATVGGPLTQLRHRYATAVEDRDATQLSLIADDLATLGCRGLATSAAVIAAARYREVGDDARGARVANRHLAGPESVAARASANHALVATDLSPREREIAVLAAAGLASKEIADRLVLSRRTVDNHLQRAYAKLGVTRRQDLAGVLGTIATAS